MSLTRTQQKVYEYLRDNADTFEYPLTLAELCTRLGLSSRGSLHKHIQALIREGLVEPMGHKQRGIRLISTVLDREEGIPFAGRIAAGRPIEAVEQRERMQVPPSLCGNRPCYVLEVCGDSMRDVGIMNGDYLVVEQRDHARNGEFVVALIDGDEATLKRIEQRPDRVVLHPENAAWKPMEYRPDQVRIQGVVVGQMRSYR